MKRPWILVVLAALAIALWLIGQDNARSRHAAAEMPPAVRPLDPWARQLIVEIDWPGGVHERADPNRARQLDPLVRGSLVTRRVEMPLSRNLWFVAMRSDGLADDKPHVSYIFENRTPGVYGLAPAPLTYTAHVRDPENRVDFSETIKPNTPHGPWQRWRHQSREWPRDSARDLPRLVAAGWFFAHRLEDPRWAGDIDVPDWSPLGNMGFNRAMGTTGGRQEIGVYPRPFARAIRTRSEKDLAAGVRMAEAHGSMPRHVRDDTGRMVLLIGRDNLSRQLSTYYGTHSAPADTIDYLRLKQGGWSMDTAHPGNAAGPMVALQGGAATADPYMVEEVQFIAAAQLNQAANSYDRGPDGLLLARLQGRDYAWGMVGLAWALRASPEAPPSWLLPRAVFQHLFDANLDAVHALIGRPGFEFYGAALRKTVTVDASDATGKPMAHVSNVLDYVPAALLYVYRLTGDRRALDIAVAQADGRIAKRYLASPKFASLYALVGREVDGQQRLYGSWQQAYAATGRASTAADRWYRFTMPTGDEVDPVTGKPWASYHGDQSGQYLYVLEALRDAGVATPDILRAIELLRSKLDETGDKLSAQDQFAIVWTPLAR